MNTTLVKMRQSNLHLNCNMQITGESFITGENFNEHAIMQGVVLCLNGTKNL